jgi:exodeoxyribonuclease VII large subunit
MAITLTELNEILKDKLPKNSYHVKGEVSRPKLYPSALYFSLKDDNININCKMWRSKLTDEMINIENGDNIEIKAQFDIYKGNLSLTVNWAKKLDNIGDLHATFELMKQEFKKNGYFDKKILLPKIIKKIVLITSLKGAAVHDFEYAISNGNSLIDIIKIDAQVQGSECPNQIIDHLNKYDFSECDLIVITRGGGSMEDLWGFNDRRLIETIYKRNKPILSAIGHMIDITLIDFAADISAPTPSLAAQYIVDHNKKYIEDLKLIKQNMYNITINDINKQLLLLDKLSNITTDIKSNIKHKLDDFKNNILYDIKNQIMRLEVIENKHNNNNNNIILLYKNNDNISYDNFINIIKNKEKFTLVWNDIKINIDNYI